MRNSLLVALFGLISFTWLAAQTPPQVASIDQSWPEGEKHIYRFLADDKEIGQLETVMDDISRKNGRVLCRIKEKLDLNIPESERSMAFGVDGYLTIDDSGHFRSSEVTIRVDDRSEKLKAVYDSAEGAVMAGPVDNEAAGRKIETPGQTYALDNFMIHQFELALFGRTFFQGLTFTVQGLSVQGMYTAEYQFLAVGKTRVQYGAFADSVWQIDLVSPGKAELYVDRRYRVVKWVDPAQRLSAEVVIDPFARRKGPQKSLVDKINDQVVRLPIYGIYLIIGAIWLLFLGRDSYRLKWSYLLFIIGGLLYPVIYLTQAPLQQYYAVKVLGPALGRGESIIIPAVIPALLTGLIQESLKIIPLLLAARWLKVRPLVFISLGAFVGAGFGWVEACNIVAPLFQARVLTGYTLVERVFTMMFHVTTGALLGYGIARKKTWQFWLAAVGLHWLANYAVVFVQLKILSIKGLNIIIGLYDIVLLVGMTALQRLYNAAHPATKKARS